jgi:gliding motility-associated-like protein
VRPVETFDEVKFFNITKEPTTQWSWNFLIDNRSRQIRSENTSLTFDNAGLYPVAFVVENSFGCKDTVIKTIKIEQDFVIYIPDVFTPNGDALNDYFLPVTRGINKYSMKIFNRWGEILFETANVEQGWDGSYRGEVCKQDVYAYKIILSSNTGDQKEYAGKVTLIR